jgi:SAM-dependent methyltransferase
MNADLFIEMAHIEENHWWFVARREILETVISKLPLPAVAKILDAGCGTGGNLYMLSRYGSVYGVEMDGTARDFATARQIGTIASGSLPDNLPFTEKSFDLVVIFDVLEHLDDDVESLRTLRSQLKPGGFLLVTVPAYRFLWSRHDEIHHHRRRYTARELRKTIENTGYNISKLTYFNMWLLPFMIASRIAQKLTSGSVAEGREVPGPLVNRVMRCIFASERLLLGSVSLPAGGSLLALARNP